MTMTNAAAPPAPVQHLILTVRLLEQRWQLHICVAGCPRRGLSRFEAAKYIGVSPSKFDQLVKDGRMPKPKRIDGRLIWDIRELDIAFDDLTDGGSDRDEDTWADLH